MKLYSDTKIADDVRAALRFNPNIARSAVTISVSDGEVYLDGQVDNFFDSVHAEDLACRVAGVVKVKNDLLVSHRSHSKTDREIAESLADQLWWCSGPGSESVTMSVNNGDRNSNWNRAQLAGV